MRKLYTTLLISAIITGTNATLPEGGEVDEDCVTATESIAWNITDLTGVFDEATITIYPNPVKSYATISFTYENIDKISILNIVGREIKTITPEPGKQEVKVSLIDLQPGVYFLAAYYQGSTLITKKFLKED